MVQIIVDTDEKQQLYNNMVFIRDYERYLINIYNELIDNGTFKTDGDNYKLDDDNNKFTEKKQQEANLYIQNYFLDDTNALNRYNEILGCRKNKLRINLELKKQNNKYGWYNKYKLMKKELIDMCN